MELTSLITTLLAALSPFVKKGAEEFAGAAGQNVYQKGKTIFNKLKERWSNKREDQEASDILKKYEEKPERYEGILEEILQEKLSQDKELFEELAKLLQDGNNLKIDISQNIDIGEDVTGLKANKMNKGSANIKQDINQGKKIIGADLDSIG